MDRADEQHGPPVLGDWHRAHGAHFAGEGRGARVVHYGDPAAEYDCLQQGGAALFHDAGRAVLELWGADRVRFLNGLLTCDLKVLGEDQGAYGFFTDLKGRVLSDGVVVGVGERLHVEVPGGATVATAVVAHLEKYRVADRVEILRREELVAMVLMGSGAAAGAGVSLPTARWGVGTLPLAGLELLVVRDHHRGGPAWTLWVPSDDAPALAEHLVERCGLRPVGGGAFEVVRVESGLPRFGVDFGPDNLPQETGLEAEAVHYDKGCYLGQEVVARLHYRGQAARRMCRLLFEGEEAPEPGPLYADGRQAGELTSVVRSPRYGRPVGLGVVQRRIDAGGRVHTAAGRSARVEELAETDVPRETSPP